MAWDNQAQGSCTYWQVSKLQDGYSLHSNTAVGSIIIESVPQLLLQVQRCTCGSPMYKYMMNKRYSRGLTPGARSMVVGRRGKAIRESG